MAALLSNLLPLVFGLVIVVVAVFHYWYLAYKAELEASLKHEMITRGMSAEEIRLVLDNRELTGPKVTVDDLA